MEWLRYKISRAALWAFHAVVPRPGPSAGNGKCHHCGAPATEMWCSSVCADFRTRGQWQGLCTECDIEFNAMSLRFFHGDSRDDDIALYAEAKREADIERKQESVD